MATPKKTASGRWWVQIEVAGQRASGTFDTKSEATTWAARKSTELRVVRSGGAGKIKTLRDAIERYAQEVSSTKKSGDFELARFAAFEKPEHAALPLSKRMAEITTADLALWRDSRLAQVSKAAVLRDMTIISALFEHARREWQWIPANPMRDLRRPSQPKHRERVISWQEVRRMLRQLGWPARRSDGSRRVRSVNQAVAVCFMVALRTGMRAGELCALGWDDIKADHAKIRDGKTGRRDVPLTPQTLRAIEMAKGWDDELVFGLKTQSLDALFRKARGLAGLDGFTFHDSRHTAATRLAQRLHVLDLCKVFGWTQTSRALTYYNPTASELARRMSSGK